MLPLCLGEATKLAGGLLGANKAYIATACLGVNTDTDDSEGQVIQTRPLPSVGIEQIERALIPLRGIISQHPPVYSALKRDGEAQYARARRGEEVVTQAREVRSEEHTSELQSLMRISYAVFCLKKQKIHSDLHLYRQ